MLSFIFSSWRLWISMLIITSLTDLVYISVIWKQEIILKAVCVIWHKVLKYQSIACSIVLYIYNHYAVHVKFSNKTHLSPLRLLSWLSKSFFFSCGSDYVNLLPCRPISVIPILEDETMVVFSLERNKPIKCKTMLLFCHPD